MDVISEKDSLASVKRNDSNTEGKSSYPPMAKVS
jgi:hypothetical protein